MSGALDKAVLILRVKFPADPKNLWGTVLNRR